LNVIRAGIAATPESSEYTSAFDRIRARWQRAQDAMETEVVLPSEEEADAWLAPIFLDERAAAYPGATADASPNDAPCEAQAHCNPIGAPRISNKGFLPLTLDQYLLMLDTLGRMARQGKRGCIPASLAPILDRLKVDVPSWLDSILEILGIDRAPASEVPRMAFG
jgi:hypothetical protein